MNKAEFGSKVIQLIWFVYISLQIGSSFIRQPTYLSGNRKSEQSNEVKIQLNTFNISSNAARASVKTNK